MERDDAARASDGPVRKARSKFQPKSTSNKRRAPRQPNDDSDHELLNDKNELIGSRRAKPSKKARFGRTAGKQYPPDIRKALGIANALYVDRKIPEALLQLQQVVQKCGSIPEPYALLGLIYLDDGKLPNALTFYKLACTRDPRNLQYHQQAARISRELGDHTSRLEILRVLARLQPTDLNVAMEKASCLMELERPRQALEAYAKAAKRFPRKLDIYLELAERVECNSPPQDIFVQQALASCLRRAMGKRFLGPDVRDLADAFATRLHEIKLERSKPNRLPPRPSGLPSRRVYEAATKAADLLVTKLMENRKRQESQYELAVQVVEGLVSWLDYCRGVAAHNVAGGGRGGGYEDDDREEVDGQEVDSDSDLRGSNNEESEGEQESESDGRASSVEEDDIQDEESGDDDEQDEPMDCFVVEHTLLLRYGLCQLYCGEKANASRAFAFLRNEDADGEYGDMMLEIAKVYGETDNMAESIVFLRLVAQSMHPQHRLAGVQLGAAYNAQGKHELAADAYSAVLAERPQHAAALAGLAEAAYWRGKRAAAKALLMLTPAVAKATSGWAGEQPPPPPEEDDEGEEAYGMQRVQLLLQWATLSRIAGNAANFACVALPLVSVALRQMAQRQRGERDAGGTGGAAASRGGGHEEDVLGRGSDRQENETGEGARREGEGKSGEDNNGNSKSSRRRPSPVPLLLPVRKWQAGIQGNVSALTLHLLSTVDVVAQVGRRAVFWHVVELVRSLRELGVPEDAAVVAASALNQAAFLRSVERDDLQVVAAKDNLVVLRSMPDGCPILGPASVRPVLSGPVRRGDTPPGPSEDAVSVIPSGHYFSPPWRSVEERYDVDVPRRVGSVWRPSNRSSQPGNRRSRNRRLRELAEYKNKGDVICSIVLALAKTPDNDAMWNLLQRVATKHGVDSGDGGFHGEQVEAIVGRHRERAHGLIYRGHDAVIWNRAKQALKLYGHAHALRPQEPLPILCLGTHIIRMVTVTETMLENDGVCVLQALACLHRYADLRKARTAVASGGEGEESSVRRSDPAFAIPDAVLEQETLYNLGRGYHQVGLAELAMEYYNRALRVEDERGKELRSWHGGGVTREVAYNLCALYKRSGSTAMALGMMQKYLTVG